MSKRLMTSIRSVRHRHSASIQKGWMLLEAAIACALLGLMSVAVYHTVKATQTQTEVASEKLFLPQAEMALAGLVRQNPFHLPLPGGAVPSLSRPGYIEGWLPNSALGLPASRHVRYMVHESLVKDIVTVYKPDPLKLVGNHILVRGTTQINGLDFCLVLMKAEMAGTALPNGMRVAFALQEVTRGSNLDKNPNQLWIADSEATAPSVGMELITLTAGFSEFSEMLGCREKFSRLAANIKAAAVQESLVKLAVQQEAYKTLAVVLAQQSLASLEWKRANLYLFLARFAADFTFATVQFAMSPAAGKPVLAATTASSALYITGVGLSLGKVEKSLDKAGTTLDTAKNAVIAAAVYRQELEALRDITAAQANLDQLTGIDR